ncbi:hypothetical protein AQUSIP_09700 [Aquicella siphonis]|uniref:DUF1343 domain-containing protein n=1 Tax=Aquicella siphonis TaxID=254247 RepID=A0A5E4PFB9_9COXI|nr:DUF1343 domain-containing protein [Aquicella siphonis]VVC75680.1 hypothetical protein AQUSIP_09700 [Aquicella siphonis]
MKKTIFLLVFLLGCLGLTVWSPIQPGAEQTALYLPLLQGKKVGVFANHSSRVGNAHLVDMLRSHGIQVTKIFVPEHGFRGDADDGDKIENSKDAKTGIPIISLYGRKVKPAPSDLEDVDVLIFDIQDVGVRFYTFISSLQRLMEAAVENDKPLIILDRPNPNGFYVDGPVMNPKYKSFTGMQPIPIVHGMTVGEYAKMLVGEEWLEVKPRSKAKFLKLTVIPNAHYSHKSLYEPPVAPSPNLPDIQSIYWYPSIGMMEGTAISVGRGTDTPFQVFGHPAIKTAFSFKPTSRTGARHPSYENKICHGWNLGGTRRETLKKIGGKLQIRYIMEAYRAFPDKKRFFAIGESDSDMNTLMRQIRDGVSESDIRKSWEPRLSAFKLIRKQYLLYPDFE